MIGTTEELSPETAAYRQHRRMIWQTLRARYAEAVAEALDAGQQDGAARKVGARAVRGDMRALMSELLVRAPVPAVLEFLTSGGLEWGAAGERIFEHGDAVLGLIERACPRPIWTDLEFLDHDAAANDARWSAWSLGWLQALRGASPVARDLFEERPPAAASAQPAQTASVLSGWGPWLASAAAMLSVTAAVVATMRE